MSNSGFRLVTPEAVELDLDAAGLASRFLAALLDLLVLTVVFYALLTVAALVAGASSGATGSEDTAIVAFVLFAVGIFALLVVWPTAWEVATKGRSIGKMALGLRVVTVEGAPISFRHALVRGLLGVVEILFTFGLVAVCVALGSRRFRRLGDHLAGTVVIRERGGGASVARPRHFIPYPGWEAWSARLDATGLSPDDYRLVRSFLLRSEGLRPEVRDRLGFQILVRVLPLTGHDARVATTLHGWPVQAPLVAVAAAYQRRWAR